METSQLVEEINALPQAARLAIEQLVVALRQLPSSAKRPPILRHASPLTEEEKAAEQQVTTGWADRTDILDGAEYIHEVRRGLRKP